MKFEYKRTPSEEFKLEMELSLVWNTLQSKSEYLSAASEKGYQSIAALAARSIARILKADVDLSEALTMCKGAYFPINGKAGKKCMMTYLREKGIYLSEAQLGTNFIKWDLNEKEEVVTPEFEALLMELFDDEKNLILLKCKLRNFAIKLLKILRKCKDQVKHMKVIYCMM